MIGYSGTGYKGMQISASEKTIEGDLFNAFIAAGAISKANADDPKKASLVRCARTDKGVHAAGNMISLKLIIEDDDIVQKINDNLSPQIRVWGMERTTGGFSCYQACDSRWYEYLIPSYAFLPPHPSSWLAKKLDELAEEAGDKEGFDERQAEVQGFWKAVEDDVIKPIIDTIDEDIRYDVVKALQGDEEANALGLKDDADIEQPVKLGKTLSKGEDRPELESEKTEDAAIIINEPALAKTQNSGGAAELEDASAQDLLPEQQDRLLRLRAATKRLRLAYSTAKRHYRIPQRRIERVQEALNRFVGTSNFHNYTIQKTFRDPSAKRHIKSFMVNPKPILIGDGPAEEKTQWLSLKVHGQSFMMHQIRKMVGMVTLLVRCGSKLDTLNDSLTSERYSIPKVPGLGLLLERPVFDSYNNIQAPKHNREKLDFGKYETELEAFKQKEIYQRIFTEEEEKNEFVKFFNHIDNFKEPWFLYLSSKGLEACNGLSRREGGLNVQLAESDDEGEDEDANGEEGG